MKNFESYFEGFDSTELHYQWWESNSPRAIIILTHGQGEHSGAYTPYLETQKEKNYNIFAWDLRGHGKSEGQRGYVKCIDEYERDLACFIKLIEENHNEKKLPVFLFGHSLGGLVVTKYLIANGEKGIRAASLSSPAYGLSLEPPDWKNKAAFITQQYIPRLTMGNEINPEDLTRDKEFLKSYEVDPLRHNKISARVYTGMLDSFDKIPEYAKRIKLPFLLQMSDSDPIISPSAMENVFNNIGSENKKLCVYKKNRHEIFNDLDRLQVIEDQNNFLEQFM